MRTLEMVLCALFAALSAVLSQISIPIGPVPINLTHVSIFIAAGLLGSKHGSISQSIFVLLGAFGVPVFSGFSGGMRILFGSTGGFIIGYIACTFVTGLIIERLGKSIIALIFAMYIGWIITYSFGTIWFMFLTNTSLIEALPLCVFPFLLGDIPKTLLSAVLVNQLNPVIRNQVWKLS